MAGVPVEDVDTKLRKLDSDDRYAVVCTACYLHDEVKANSSEHAQLIAAFVERHCRKYARTKKHCDWGGEEEA